VVVWAAPSTAAAASTSNQAIDACTRTLDGVAACELQWLVSLEGGVRRAVSPQQGAQAKGEADKITGRHRRGSTEDVDQNLSSVWRDTNAPRDSKVYIPKRGVL
jgi:hypothetical protein